MDPMVPADNAARLAAILRATGARVKHRTLPAGHGLSQADISLTRQFLADAGGAIVSAA
jgi:phospholipase/carboxylesterase